MNVEEIGRRTKAKYPQYQHLSDADVGQRVSAKYPQYQEQTDQPSLGQKLGDMFLGRSSSMGRGLGLARGAEESSQAELGAQETASKLQQQALSLPEGDPNRERALSVVRDTSGGIGEQLSQEAVGEGITRPYGKQALGVAGEVGSYLLPGAIAPITGATALGRVGQGALQGALSGGIYGATSPEAESVPEAAGMAAKHAATGAAVGGAISGGVEGVGAVGRGAKKLGDWLGKTKDAVRRQATAQILQPTIATLEKDLSTSVLDPEMLGVSKTFQEIVDRGEVGTAKELFAKARVQVEKLGGDISSFLSDNSDQLPGLSKASMDEIVSSGYSNNPAYPATGLDELVSRKEIAGDTSALKTIDRLKDHYTETHTFEEAYRLVDVLSDEIWQIYKSGKGTDRVTAAKARTYKTVADNLRSFLKDLVTENGFPEWVTMMDDFTYYKSLENLAAHGSARMQGALSSITSWLFSRVGPAAVVGAQKTGQALSPVVGGIGGKGAGASKLADWIHKGSLVAPYGRQENQ